MPQHHAPVLQVSTPRLSQMRAVPSRLSLQPPLAGPAAAPAHVVARSMSGNLSYAPAPLPAGPSFVVPSGVASGLEGSLRSFTPMPISQPGVAEVSGAIAMIGSPVQLGREVQQPAAPTVMASAQTPLKAVMGSPLMSARELVDQVGLPQRRSVVDHFDV